MQKNEKRKQIRRIELNKIEKAIELLDETPSRTNEAFNMLIDIYENFKIDWKNDYKLITLGEELKDKRKSYIKGKIMNNPPQSLQEIKEEPTINTDKEKEIVNLARVVQLSNKAAHAYIEKAEQLLKAQGIHLERKNIKMLYLAKDKKRYRKLLNAEHKIYRQKIEEMEGTKLETTIKQLLYGNTKLYAIKNTSLELLLDRLGELENPREKFSYGYKKDNRKERYNRDSFIFDIPGYGQMAIHTSQPFLIARMPKYEYPLYIKRNVLFFEGLNEEAKEFLELDEPETTVQDVIKTLKRSELDDEITHYLSVVLMGNNERIKLTPKDLKEIEKTLANKRAKKKDKKENQQKPVKTYKEKKTEKGLVTKPKRSTNLKTMRKRYSDIKKEPKSYEEKKYINTQRKNNYHPKYKKTKIKTYKKHKEQRRNNEDKGNRDR